MSRHLHLEEFEPKRSLQTPRTQTTGSKQISIDEESELTSRGLTYCMKLQIICLLALTQSLYAFCVLWHGSGAKFKISSFEATKQRNAL